MRLAPTGIGQLLLLAAVAFATSTTFLQLRQAAGGTTPPPPVVAIVVLVALAVAVLVVAWPVRRWNRGHRDRPLNPLRAARTVALAKSAALSGAVLSGGWLGFVAIALPLVTLQAQAERAVAAGAVVLASLALTGAGLLAERWCMIPPEDDDEDGPGRSGGRQPNPA